MLFLMLFCLLIIAPCSFITLYANHLITENISNTNKNFLDTSSISLDNALSAAAEQAMSLVINNSSDFHTLLLADNYDQPDTALAAYHFNTAIRESLFNKELFSDVFLYFKNPGIVFTSAGTQTRQSFFDEYRIFEDYPPNFFDSLLKRDYKNILCPPTDITTRDTVGQISPYGRCLPFAVNLSGYTASDAVLVLLLKEDLLNETLARLNISKTSYLYLLNMQDHAILNQPADKDYASLLSLSEASYDGSSGEFVRQTDDTYHIYWKKSSVNRLLYICVEPKLLITGKLQSFLFRTIAIIFAAVLLAAFIYYIISRRIFGTLSDIFRRLRQNEKIPAAAKENPDELSLQNLKEAIERLCIREEQDRPKLVHTFLSGLFSRNLEQEEITAFLSRFSLFPNGSAFCIFILKTDGQTPFTALSKDFPESLGYCISSPSPSEALFFLYAADTHSIEEKQTELEKKILSAFEDGYAEYKAVLSPVFCNIHDTYSIYRKTRLLLKSHGTNADKIFYTEKDISTVSAKLLPSQKKQMSSYIKTSPQKCPDFMEELLLDFRKKDIPFAQFASIVQELLFLLQEALYEQAIQFVSVFSMEEQEFLSRLHAILLPKSLEDFGIGFYRNYAKIRQTETLSMSFAEQTLLSFIDGHLANVNLTMLSDATGMNPNYLSSYFKKHFDITFVEYVTRKKIDKAKEMLTGTDLTCKAIGESLGYRDQNVFTRTFKKLEAVTPNEYRRTHYIKPDEL